MTVATELEQAERALTRNWLVQLFWLSLSLLINCLWLAPLFVWLLPPPPSLAPGPPQVRLRLASHQPKPPLKAAPKSTLGPRMSPGVAVLWGSSAAALPAPVLVTPPVIVPEARPQLPDNRVPQASISRRAKKPRPSPPPGNPLPLRPSQEVVSWLPPQAATASLPEEPPLTIPDKAARPIGHPPRTTSSQVLQQLGGKWQVQLRLQIFPDGHLESQLVRSSGNSELDQAVMQDVRHWTWEPAKVAGRPVLSQRLQELQLEL